jgi:hypothetical protein
LKEVTMKLPQVESESKLRVVKTTHSLIYVVMASATFYVFYCGLVGRQDPYLAVAIGLVLLEGAVFFGNGMRCPLTELAQRYGDPKGYVGDTLFPEACTRYTFRVFGSLFAIGLTLVIANQLWR